MKTFYSTLILLMFSFSVFAQGIAVQGVARDNANAAISDTNMTFTFSITKDDNTVLFSETQSIRTDNFGVFSHIVSTGNPSVATFNDVDFSLQGLRIKVSVNYDSNNIEVYNQPFQYTPYAHYARNGVPTGTIMPYVGDTPPEGWLMCDGSQIPTGEKYDNLKNLINAMYGGSSVARDRTPNLRGRFLKGAGGDGEHNDVDTYEIDRTVLGQYQHQAFQNHSHDKGTLQTANDGAHGHRGVLIDMNGLGTNGQRVFNTGVEPHGSSFTGVFREDNSNNTGAHYRESGKTAYPLIGSSGSNHRHQIEGKTSDAVLFNGASDTQPFRVSNEETRPHNFSVNYIIKI